MTMTMTMTMCFDRIDLQLDWLEWAVSHVSHQVFRMGRYACVGPSTPELYHTLFLMAMTMAMALAMVMAMAKITTG